MASARRAEVIRRSLASGECAGVEVIDAIACHDGLARVLVGSGTPPGAFAPDGAPGCATPRELREIAGGTLVITDPAPAVRLALASGSVVEARPAPEETALFSGLNTIFGQRIDEPADAVAEGLAYHARHHGLQAALLLVRVPDAAFAGALARGLGRDAWRRGAARRAA